MRTWSLENVEEAAAARPDTFFIPPLSERLARRPGDRVRLHFVLLQPGPDQPRAERMWVEVIERIDSNGSVRYRGTLTNRPVHIADLRQGAVVEFGAEHVARTLIERSDPRWLEIGELSAFVSARVLAAGQRARWAYREEPDRPEDSGWRFFAGDETEEYTNDPANVRLCDVYWLADRDPSLHAILRSDAGAAFEWDPAAARWTPVAQ